MLRILVADDHSAIRASLRALIEIEQDLEVVADVTNGVDAVRAVAETRPDVVVIDLSMPGMTGLEAVREIAALRRGPAIVALSMHQGRESLGVAIEAGARGYLVKTDADRELVSAIRAVATGDRYYPSRPPPTRA